MSFREMADAQLVEHYVAGDERAFAEIIERYHKALWWVARRYSQCESDTEDILQDAYLRASKNLHRFRKESSLKTWLHRVVRNAGYDFVHSSQRREEAVLDDDTNRPKLIQRMSHDPISYFDVTLTLIGALSLLKPEQRAALVLIDVIGYNVKTAAKQQGVAPGTMKSRRARAKTKMAQALQPALLV